LKIGNSREKTKPGAREVGITITETYTR